MSSRVRDLNTATPLHSVGFNNQPTESEAMPAKAALHQVVVSVAPKQMKAIDRDARGTGLSRRMFMQQLTEEFLLRPTSLVAGGIYRKPDRERLRFHLSTPLHNAISKYAQKQGVTISVIVATAINNRYPN